MGGGGGTEREAGTGGLSDRRDPLDRHDTASGSGRVRLAPHSGGEWFRVRDRDAAGRAGDGGAAGGRAGTGQGAD